MSAENSDSETDEDEAVAFGLSIADCLTSKVHPKPVTDEELRHHLRNLAGDHER